MESLMLTPLNRAPFLWVRQVEGPFPFKSGQNA
jgi:hypothetical protein